ncbi:hypothetical protein BJX63DRAFT_34814 [Aspergillus granulosus]|uniref:Uncharacterized protein n=1 Tax=Aspergillus granulosus TaxID=176169 RepID=A0ABR4GZ74_9EURO
MAHCCNLLCIVWAEVLQSPSKESDDGQAPERRVDNMRLDKIYLEFKILAPVYSRRRARSEGNRRGFWTNEKTREGEATKDTPNTYDHRVWRTGLPVRSAVLKPHAGRLVVWWVTTCESLLLYVRLHVFFFLLVGFSARAALPSVLHLNTPQGPKPSKSPAKSELLTWPLET